MKKITTYLTLGIISSSIILVSSPAESMSYRDFLQQHVNGTSQQQTTTEQQPEETNVDNEKQSNTIANFWNRRRNANTNTENNVNNKEENKQESAPADSQDKTNGIDDFWANRRRANTNTNSESEQSSSRESSDSNQEKNKKTYKVSQRELNMLDLINQERKAAGVSPLKIDEQVSRLANMKSQDFIDNNYFAHESPVYGRANQMLRDENISFRRVGENIASSQSYIVSHHRLMASDGHRRNILNPNYTHVGIGIVDQNPSGVYVTQIFITK
ncbi:CAP domain-containing protein [Proteinivorax tanatarense]|uniref:CAP domain-containing protein n=1 Tax=Proteinivorax tanatarense TaxID=1260629 RepID=A0AAU7VNM2_9FIRM